MITEQETLEKLRATLYDGQAEIGRERQREPGPGPGYVKVPLDDLADYLALHPGATIPKGKPMICAKCGQPFQGGAFRVFFQAGVFCRYCYGLLALAPLSARCIVCKQRITIGDWRYNLHAVVNDGGDLKRYYVHGDCAKELRRPSLQKAA